MRFPTSQAHRVAKIVNGYFSYYLDYAQHIFYALHGYERHTKSFGFTRDGEMWNCCGGDGSGYKSYFWIIHPPPTGHTPKPRRVGEFASGCRGVRTHIYARSVRPWQLVTAPLTKGYWFISLSSKQRFIILYIIRL